MNGPLIGAKTLLFLHVVQRLLICLTPCKSCGQSASGPGYQQESGGTSALSRGPITIQAPFTVDCGELVENRGSRPQAPEHLHSDTLGLPYF